MERHSTKLDMQDNIHQVAELISQGKTKKEVLDYLRYELGIAPTMLSTYYHQALKGLIMDDDMMGDYKKSIQQQNYDRLEQIVAETISGNTMSKKIAIDAIKELNHMAGAYEGNTVTVAQNKEGDQIIQIKFQ